MKSSKSSINRKTHAVPNLRFEDQKLTSFSGLTVFQTLFDHLSLKNSLRACFNLETVVGSRKYAPSECNIHYAHQ